MGWGFPKERLVGERLTAGAEPVPERLTVCGLPAALSEMLTEAVRVPVAPGVKVTLIVHVPLAAGTVPVPERLTVWGLPLALSVMLTEAVRLPLAVGVKVTPIVQLDAPATELPQVLVWAKSPALVPVIARLVMLKAALPVLLRVTV